MTIVRLVFPASLGLLHDSIDVSGHDANTDLVYGQILEMLGEEPLE